MFMEQTPVLAGPGARFALYWQTRRWPKISPTGRWLGKAIRMVVAHVRNAAHMLAEGRMVRNFPSVPYMRRDSTNLRSLCRLPSDSAFGVITSCAVSTASAHHMHGAELGVSVLQPVHGRSEETRA